MNSPRRLCHRGPRFRHFIRAGVAGGVWLSILVSHNASAQDHSAFPVDIASGPSPQPVMADGRLRFAYELRVTNFSSSPIEIRALDVVGDSVGPGRRAIASLRGSELVHATLLLGANDSSGSPVIVAGGRAAILFLDLSLAADERAPALLGHQFLLAIPAHRDGSGGMIERSVRGPTVAVVNKPVLVLRPPLRGPGWVAFNALFSDHRRSYSLVDGKETIAQRFAIDWMKLGPDGRFSSGADSLNASFYGEGADVLAVANGRVSEVVDQYPENAGQNPETGRRVTLENVAGNHLILDLGSHRFALYAHLQPGSIRVKLGDSVSAGEVLAHLGNSGNSDAPHLHFQVMDANSMLAAEGLPYELTAFTQLGFASPSMLDTKAVWHASNDGPRLRRHEFPLESAVISFP